LLNRAPEEAPPPVPVKDTQAKDECLARPGKPADGQHWRYRLDGHRRCWFLAPEEIATSRQRVRHHAVKRRLASSEEDETAPRKQRAVVDARAELMRPAPEEALQPTPVPAVKVVDAAPSVPATGAAVPAPAAGAAVSAPAAGAAALVPPPPVLAKRDRLPSEQPDVRKDDVRNDNVETLLAATPASSEAIAVSASPASAVAVPVDIGEDVQWWTSRWIGPLLMALGLMSLVVATRPLQRAALVTRSVRAPEAEERLGRYSDSESQAHLHDRRHAPAMRHGARQIADHQRTSRQSGPANPDMTFQDAIRMLTDFDEASFDARSGALTPRPLDAAPASGKARAYVSRMG
jgi:hypothetical protein